MKRRSRLRPSFVIVTVGASVAAAVACSSSSTTPSNNPTDAGGLGAIDSPNNGLVPGCPAALPAMGTPCSGTNSCDYDGGTVVNQCGTFPTTANVTCSGGMWQAGATAVTTCNPGLSPDAGSDAADEAASGDASDDGG